MSSFTYASTARVGRENQLFAANGARLVAGCVPLNKRKTKVLLIGSFHTGKWVIPKGGVEKDEPDFEASARRETWEEAGVTGEITKDLGLIEDLRPKHQWGVMTNETILRHPPRSEFHFFEMIVEEEHDEYPEAGQRSRRWATYEEAIALMQINNRPELALAIERSSIRRGVHRP